MGAVFFMRENIDMLCFSCGKIGHVKQFCNLGSTCFPDKNNETDNNSHIKENTVQPNSNANPNIETINNKGEDFGDNQDYGPWTIVTNKRSNYHSKHKLDNSRGRNPGAAFNNARINDYGKNKSVTFNGSKNFSGIVHQHGKDNLLVPSAQSKKSTQHSEEQQHLNNNEQNILPTSPRKVAEQSKDIDQHVDQFSKQMEASPLEDDILNPSTPSAASLLNTVLSGQGNSNLSPPFPSFNSSSSSIPPFPSASSPSPSSYCSPNGSKPNPQIDMHGIKSTTNNHLSETADRSTEEERLWSNTGHYPTEIAGRSVGNESTTNSQSFSSLSRHCMQDNQGSEINLGGAEEQHHNSQFAEVSGRIINDPQPQHLSGPSLSNFGGTKCNTPNFHTCLGLIAEA
ncbi:uncharacterized protein [Spinacia oleracea]|uniref:CCHC-type domain-containing protein n=1 Tax=Spinacia oleracea TaxID=3562 RepID=A0ABM3R9K5_SPIOL|nr:uncharacterized protein LOC130467713 [Spinacia oleracea]